MKNFAIGLDLKALSPEMLEALAEALKTKAGLSQPPEEWRPFFLALQKAPNMLDTLHQFSHAVDGADCSRRTTGIAVAMMFGYELAVALSETSLLESTVDPSKAN